MKTPVLSAARITAYFLAFFLLGLAHWLGVSFDSPSIDQILYHLHYSDGLGFDVGRIFLFTFAMECLAFPLAFAIAASVLHGLLLRRRVFGVLVPVLALCLGVGAVMSQLQVFEWIGYRFAQDRFAQYFLNAGDAAAQPQPRADKTRNLVLIYVESLEATYGREQIWGRDLLAPLRSVGGVSFSDYRPAPGTQWTIAGIVGTQCGVPLKVYSQQDIRKTEGARAFLPGATCLGDVLQRHGYRNVFLGGAPLSFAGKGTFLADHGYGERYGREEWVREGVRPHSLGEWGLYDDELFARARSKLAQLHASGQRFNLTLLTLDMHNPHGFRSPACIGRGQRNFEDIVECTSHQAAEFVRFIQQSGYLKDTNVVILGDHLAVSNPVFNALRKAPDRRIYNQFISQEPPAKNTEQIIPFDVYPSILEFIGFDVPARHLGLGYSAFGEPNPKAAVDRLRDLTLPSLSGSSRYESLWESP